MHELPVTEAILTTTLKHAEAAGRRRVVAIELVIGEMTSFVDDSVQFYFDVLSRGTSAEGAALRIRRIAALATCTACGDAHPVRPPLDPLCPACGSAALRVTGGDELLIHSIEVDDEDPGHH
jgi:hydrogenase nickel incorporation protein HypA/HybF